MQIIVVDKRLARALTLSITRRHALAASITLALGVLLLSGRIFVSDGARCVRVPYPDSFGFGFVRHARRDGAQRPVRARQRIGAGAQTRRGAGAVAAARCGR